MTMTVKRLIAELEKLENKFLEVKITTTDWKIVDIDFVRQAESGKNVYIRTKEIK